MHFLEPVLPVESESCDTNEHFRAVRNMFENIAQRSIAHRSGVFFVVGSERIESFRLRFRYLQETRINAYESFSNDRLLIIIELRFLHHPLEFFTATHAVQIEFHSTLKRLVFHERVSINANHPLVNPVRDPERTKAERCSPH